MKALRFDGKRRSVQDAVVPRRPGEALVKVLRAGICNTDLEILKGYSGFKGTLGHEFVGVIVEAPDPSTVGHRVVGEINAGCGRCCQCASGDSRHCPDRTVLGIKGREGAFAEYLALPPTNLLQVPDTISDEAAVFVEPLAAACHVLEQVDLDQAAQVAIIGDGKLGQLVAVALRTSGCDLTLFGKHPQKMDIATRTGARCVPVPEANSGFSRQFDVVIEASGSPGGLPLAMDLVRPLGAVVLKSTYHGGALLDLSKIVVNEIRIVGSRCGRFGRAIEMLASGSVDVSPFISARYELADGLIALQRAGEPGVLKVLLQVSTN
jgi:threonine dehydrogenase-like Zn-dependent dehydrogenase